MQRMWLQNNVQEKDKKMYPFPQAFECIWEAADGDKVYKGNRMEDLSNCVRILQGQKSIQQHKALQGNLCSVTGNLVFFPGTFSLFSIFCAKYNKL